jgi:hypothetical protein
MRSSRSTSLVEMDGRRRSSSESRSMMVRVQELPAGGISGSVVISPRVTECDLVAVYDSHLGLSAHFRQCHLVG